MSTEFNKETIENCNIYCYIVNKITERKTRMNILITGGSGFLGRRVAASFARQGYTVLTPSHAQMDITEPAMLNDWFSRNQPRFVLHCAAVSDTGLCQKEPERTARINVEGSVNLAAVCARYGAKLIFCSSDQVYAGSSLPGPHREDHPLAPATAYAKQKLLAEQQCRALCPDTVILRLSWMYGVDSYPDEPGHLLKALCQALADPQLPLSWPLYDRRGITNVEEVVRNLPAVLNFPASVYNFGAGNDRDTYHTVKEVLEQLGLYAALERLEPNLQAFADAPRDIRMDGSLAKSLGVSFESTCDGLCRALCAVLPPEQQKSLP